MNRDPGRRIRENKTKAYDISQAECGAALQCSEISILAASVRQALSGPNAGLGKAGRKNETKVMIA